MGIAKRHHFVPAFYLRRFADENGRVAVLRRDGSSFVASTQNVLVEVRGYDIPGEPSHAEELLGEAESAAAAVLEEIDSSGKLPVPQSKAHHSLSLYMALQLTRTRDLIALVEFTIAAREAAGSTRADEDWMKNYLSTVLGFSPRPPEVRAAHTLAFSPSAFSDLNRAQMRIRMMFDAATKELGPHIAGRTWSLEVARKPSFFSSDRPIGMWRAESDRDRIEGVGVLEADELRFPIDPEKTIIAHLGGRGGVRRVGPERRTAMNTFVARHCTQLIFSRPDLQHQMPPVLNHRRPVVRFWEGPAHDRAGQTAGQDVVHFWSPIRDIPDSEEHPYAPNED